MEQKKISASAIISISCLLISIVTATFNLTGNAVANSPETANLVSLVFFIIGISSGLYYIKTRN